MNTYEFWNDMDKIFDAIVAYQEKTIEFNKQFVNPWIKLGKVFDKQESSEIIVAFKNAVEIDPGNPQNWVDLASAYTRTGNFEMSIQAYQKALQLGFESGELYKNMALAFVMNGQFQESVPVFEKSLKLLNKSEEKALVWNQLGNVYRKLDNYEMALQAFLQADQFEARIQKDETASAENLTEEPVALAEEIDASVPTDEPAPVFFGEDTLEEEITDEEDAVSREEASETDASEEPDDGGYESEEDEDDNDLPVILELDFSTDSTNTLMEKDDVIKELPVPQFLATLEKELDEAPAQAEAATEEPQAQNESEVAQEALLAVEEAPEYSHPLIAMLEDAGDDEADQEIEVENEPSPVVAQDSTDAVEDEVDEEVDDEFEEELADDEEKQKFLIMESDDGDGPEFTHTQAAVSLTEEQTAQEESLEVSETAEEVAPALASDITPIFSAYDEYLKDNSDSDVPAFAADEETQTLAMAPVEVAETNSEINLDVNTDITVEMDTKNAHVWNELGNVYFNAGSFDDAIVAYNKAIELDKQFAWPYTNLALSYVQQGRLDDAISLYQRSIELFSSEKDMAVTWNRLGNVYRRMNDYENAIAAYQRADELDPGSIAIAQQSRFSLLGSEKVSQEVGYSV